MGGGGGGLLMSRVIISKPVVSRIVEEVMSLMVIYYVSAHFCVMSQFQPISVSFVAIFAVLCHCFKAILVI